MRRQTFTPERDGFCGAWYPAADVLDRRCAVILMLGDSSTDWLARCGARWLGAQGCQVLAMSPARRDYSHHSYPLERFGRAIAFLKAQGCDRIAIAGASTTAMLALLAASYYPDISLTIAVSPPDFVMEGFVRDGLDGARERPADGESSVTWQGKPLPYLPYAYRHPEYWRQIKADSKAGGDLIASRRLFDESERRHPIKEEERIKVERISGRVICIGAEDDALWDTCTYIRRMQERLGRLEHSCTFESWLFEHGTHFAFPESLLRMLLPVGSSLLVALMFRAGRVHASACRRTRIEIGDRLRRVLHEWQREGAD